jgi:hypothetical protein
MKRRVRTQPSNSFYSNEPAVAKGLMADNPPVQNASLGNKPPRTVDKKPGRMSGFAGFADKHKPAQKSLGIKPPAFGTKAKSPKQTRVPSSKPSKPVKLGGLKKI